MKNVLKKLLGSAENITSHKGLAQKVIWALIAPALPPDVRQGYALPLAVRALP